MNIEYESMEMVDFPLCAKKPADHGAGPTLFRLPTNTHTHTHTHTHRRTHVHMYTQTRTHACTHVRTHAHTQARTHARTHARMHAHTENAKSVSDSPLTSTSPLQVTADFQFLGAVDVAVSGGSANVHRVYNTQQNILIQACLLARNGQPGCPPKHCQCSLQTETAAHIPQA